MPTNAPIKCVSDFNFRDNVDLQDLSRAWDAALEAELLTLPNDTKVQSFLIAGVRLGLRHKKISARAVALLSGYSLSTFFRYFSNIEHATEQGFLLVNSLIIKIYQKCANERELTLSEHVDLFLTLCVGAYAAYPTDMLQRMSDKYHGNIEKIHPHTFELAEAVVKCLQEQTETSGLQIATKELEGLLLMLDGNLMQTALRHDGTLVSPHYFDFLYRILYGFFMLSCTNGL